MRPPAPVLTPSLETVAIYADVKRKRGGGGPLVADTIAWNATGIRRMIPHI